MCGEKSNSLKNQFMCKANGYNKHIINFILAIIIFVIVFMNIGYLSYNLYVNVLLSLPLLFYWIMVVYYTAKARAVLYNPNFCKRK